MGGVGRDLKDYYVKSRYQILDKQHQGAAPGIFPGVPSLSLREKHLSRAPFAAKAAASLIW